MIKPGEEVIVLRSADVGLKVAYSYGRGTYLGLRRPPDGTKTPFGVVGDKTFPAKWVNPCIVLDEGGLVWGCQAHWGRVDVVEAQLAGYEFEVVDVDDLENPPLSSGAFGADEVKSSGWS